MPSGSRNCGSCQEYTGLRTAVTPMLGSAPGRDVEAVLVGDDDGEAGRPAVDRAGEVDPGLGRLLGAVDGPLEVAERDLVGGPGLRQDGREAQLEQVRRLPPVQRDLHPEDGAVVVELQLLDEGGGTPAPLDADPGAQRAGLPDDDAAELHRLAGPGVGDDPVAPGVGRVGADLGVGAAVDAGHHVDPGRQVAVGRGSSRSPGPARPGRGRSPGRRRRRAAAAAGRRSTRCPRPPAGRARAGRGGSRGPARRPGRRRPRGRCRPSWRSTGWAGRRRPGPPRRRRGRRSAAPRRSSPRRRSPPRRAG